VQTVAFENASSWRTRSPTAAFRNPRPSLPGFVPLQERSGNSEAPSGTRTAAEEKSKAIMRISDPEVEDGNTSRSRRVGPDQYRNRADITGDDDTPRYSARDLENIARNILERQDQEAHVTPTERAETYDPVTERTYSYLQRPLPRLE